jgi:exodeoxyribonuclease-3
VLAILAGDYNVVPTPFDIYPSKSWRNDALVQPQSRAAFKRIVDQGWTDSLRAFHPDNPMYTFWHYLRKRWERDAGLRIDHLLVSPLLCGRLVDASVDRERPGRSWRE